MNIFIKSILLTLSIAYVVDISGAVHKLSKWVFVKLYGDKLQYSGWFIPVLGCSTCLSFWSVLLYTVLFSGWGLIYCLTVACLCSYIANISAEILKLIKRVFSALCNNYI